MRRGPFGEFHESTTSRETVRACVLNSSTDSGTEVAQDTRFGYIDTHYG